VSPPRLEPLRTVIADDHPFYRRGLARSLRASGIDVVAEAPNGGAAIRAVEETAPDVVVMDLNMPGMSGLEATARLAERGTSTRVLVLSVSAEQADVADAILAGASGYVLKDRPVEEVVAAIRTVASGGWHVSPEIAIALLRRLYTASGAAVDLDGVALSAQEHDVLGLVARGKDIHEIADALGIGPSSIRAHAASILMSLQRDGRIQAALRASSERV
jgi:DNA-binding NarL/FixJ family response regulator